MTDKEWEEYTHRSEDGWSLDVKTRDILDLLDQRDALRAALSQALDDFRSLSKSASPKAARMHAAEAYQRVRAAISKRDS